MSNGYPFSLLNDEQMSNKVGVEHQPVFNEGKPINQPSRESTGFPVFRQGPMDQ